MCSLADESDQPIGVERLLEIRKRVSRGRDFTRNVQSCRHDDDRRLWPCEPTLSEEGESVEIGHLVVRHHHIEMTLPHFQQSAKAVTGLDHGKAGLFQPVGDDLPHIFVVVNNLHARSHSYRGIHRKTHLDNVEERQALRAGLLEEIPDYGICRKSLDKGYRQSFSGSSGGTRAHDQTPSFLMRGRTRAC